MKQKLSINDVKWHGFLLKDPHFRTFYHEGTYYRATLRNAPDFYGSKDFQNLLNALAIEELIPETKPANIEIDGFDTIYYQHSEHFNVRMHKACPLLLQEACLTYLRLCKFLQKRNLRLIDGHTGNFVVQGLNKPFWCDIGSIIPHMGNAGFSDLQEGLNFMVIPLLLRQKSSALGSLMRHCANAGLQPEVATALQLSTGKALPEDRMGCIEALEELVQGLEFPFADTLWSEYHTSITNDINTALNPTSGNRKALITRILRTLKPETVVDIASNAGLFSHIAARIGAKEILAIDSDETAIARGHHFLREHGAASSIKFMVGSVGEQVEQTADVALALALTHHLFLTNQYRWPQIAQYLARYTHKHLITEFMPNGLGRHIKQANLPPSYTLENFVKQLKIHFAGVEIIEHPTPEGSSPRILILCTNRIENSKYELEDILFSKTGD